MSRFFGLLASLTIVLATAAPAGATDSIGSEMSHAAGGAVIAGAVTYLADETWPAERGWLGFGVGAAVGVIGETYGSASGHGFSVLDAGSAAIGAALGAFVTDRYIVMPVAEPDSEQGAYFGIVGDYRF